MRKILKVLLVTIFVLVITGCNKNINKLSEKYKSIESYFSEIYN